MSGWGSAPAIPPAAGPCAACHTIRGTPSAGQIGPDLTHVGGRISVGAGILQNEPDKIREWLSRTTHIKPGVHMPSFGMLRDSDLRDMADYLHGLK